MSRVLKNANIEHSELDAYIPSDAKQALASNTSRQVRAHNPALSSRLASSVSPISEVSSLPASERTLNVRGVDIHCGCSQPESVPRSNSNVSKNGDTTSPGTLDLQSTTRRAEGTQRVQRSAQTRPTLTIQRRRRRPVRRPLGGFDNEIAYIGVICYSLLVVGLIAMMFIVRWLYDSAALLKKELALLLESYMRDFFNKLGN